MTASQELSASLDALFAAERRVRELHARIAAAPAGAVIEVLRPNVAAALASSDEAEVRLRIVRLSALLAEIEGPVAADLLVDALGAEPVEARAAAGEALAVIAFDRFKEVALAVERAIARLPVGHLALQELPFLLEEVPEPGVRKLLSMFLAHADPEAASSAIEAIVDHGDVGAAGLLVPLQKDKRTVELEDDHGDESTVTIGELATEARALLAELEAASEPQAEPRGRPGGRGGPKGERR